MTVEDVAKNRERFLNEVKTIKGISEENMTYITQYLDSSDFFYAPASAKFAGAYDGGLCEHSLNVYDNLMKLYESFHFDLGGGDEDSLKIVALFHDVGKIDTFKKEIKHRKVYDGNGNSKWEDYIGYEADDTMSVGTEEENSAYISSTLLPMTQYEYAAILNHKGFFNGEASVSKTINKFRFNKLAQYLHYANAMDMFK